MRRTRQIEVLERKVRSPGPVSNMEGVENDPETELVLASGDALRVSSYLAGLEQPIVKRG